MCVRACVCARACVCLCVCVKDFLASLRRFLRDKTEEKNSVKVMGFGGTPISLSWVLAF